MLLTNTKVSRLHKAIANNSSANIKLSKTQLYKTGQSAGFFGKLLESLLKTGLPLMKTVLELPAKSVLIQLGLTVASTVATDITIHQKMFEFGITTLIISNEEMNDIMKIAKSLE